MFARIYRRYDVAGAFARFAFAALMWLVLAWLLAG